MHTNHQIFCQEIEQEIASAGVFCGARLTVKRCVCALLAKTGGATAQRLTPEGNGKRTAREKEVNLLGEKENAKRCQQIVVTRVNRLD